VTFHEYRVWCFLLQRFETLTLGQGQGHDLQIYTELEINRGSVTRLHLDTDTGLPGLLFKGHPNGVPFCLHINNILRDLPNSCVMI